MYPAPLHLAIPIFLPVNLHPYFFLFKAVDVPQPDWSEKAEKPFCGYTAIGGISTLCSFT